MQRIPVINELGQETVWRMNFADALEALRLGKIEQRFDSRGKFIGVVMLAPKQSHSEEFHRTSPKNSPCSLTKSECMANAGIAPGRTVMVARDKVQSWPGTHDDRTPTISAGVPFGVFCPVLSHPAANEQHTPNFS